MWELRNGLGIEPQWKDWSHLVRLMAEKRVQHFGRECNFFEAKSLLQIYRGICQKKFTNMVRPKKFFLLKSHKILLLFQWRNSFPFQIIPIWWTMPYLPDSGQFLFDWQINQSSKISQPPSTIRAMAAGFPILFLHYSSLPTENFIFFYSHSLKNESPEWLKKNKSQPIASAYVSEKVFSAAAFWNERGSHQCQIGCKEAILLTKNYHFLKKTNAVWRPFSQTFVQLASKVKVVRKRVRKS